MSRLDTVDMSRPPFEQCLSYLDGSISACVFDIKPSIGADGKPVPLKYDVKSEASLFAFPKDFDCDIVPRSVRHAEAIRNLNL
ncbi:hypothetical protein BKA70DRAFT_1437683 [Coprinopsis sp. MPI-PUGE-AT-0042]|nr:hypothetical protein BKA70DRAFT_1437683 [Coprinopsis sp. MPI-PUGE-AT-0042]